MPGGIATHQMRKARPAHCTASTGAVIFIQRFDSALNFNVHFQTLFLNVMYAINRTFAGGQGMTCIGRQLPIMIPASTMFSVHWERPFCPIVVVLNHALSPAPGGLGLHQNLPASGPE